MELFTAVVQPISQMSAPLPGRQFSSDLIDVRVAILKQDRH